MIRTLTQLLCLALLCWVAATATRQAWHAFKSRPGEASIAITTPDGQARSVDSGGERAAFEGRPLQAFPETTARPVFFEGRRTPTPMAKAPPPVVVPPVVKAAPALDTRPGADGFRLHGITIAGGQPRALLEASPDGAVWVGVGDRLRSWTVAGIQTDSIRLERDGQRAIISLYAIPTRN